MKRISTFVCAGVVLSICSMTPAFAIIHNSPLLTKRTGNGCPDGMRMQSFGHGASFHQECMKKD